MEIIAYIRTDFPTKFGVPRQSGLVDALRGHISFVGAYKNPDCVRGLEGFSHIWLLWSFSEVRREQWSATVRPPRLGGNTRMGVFATRSPFRPNPIGLSCVRLLHVEYTQKDGPILHVAGADLIDGTPIYDIKPYLPFTDSHPDAQYGFAERQHCLEVRCPDELLSRIPPDSREAMLEILRQDPRPAYQCDPTRRYGIPFAGWDIRFTVSEDGVLSVHDLVKC